MLLVEVPEELSLCELPEEVSDGGVFVVEMASPEAEGDYVQDVVHFASPTAIVKVVLEGSDQCQEVTASKHLIKENLEFFEGHLRPKHIDDIKKPIDDAVHHGGYLLTL